MAHTLLMSRGGGRLTREPVHRTLTSMGRHAEERGGTFPRAPTQEEWEAMGPEEQARVVESLPGEVTWDEMAMPEGDKHSGAKMRAKDLLAGYFRHQRRKVYLGSEVAVYYPAERRFAPDLLAVLDVEPHERGKWVVSQEGKGLDWVLEVHVGGDRKKDAEYNVKRYARLGIPEYFIYDRSQEKLEAYHLATPGARQYTRMEQRNGRYRSEVLGLEFEVVNERLQVWSGNALLLETEELLARALERLEETAQQRAEESRLRAEEARLREEAERRLAVEERRREEEERRRMEVERRLTDLQAEMERLQHRGG